jgi:cysteine desulfurase NifS
MKKQDVHWKKAICGICPAGCWVQVGMQNGRMVDIKVDTGHPLGMICRRGEHAPEIVYSKHRLKHPLRRKGKKGTYDFKKISWDEAYDLIVEKLNTIKTESGPEAVGIYTGRGAFELSLCDMYQPKGVAVSSASNILFPFGSPNTMGVGALCYVSFAMIAPHVTMGRMLVNMFTDMENADLLIVWGANPATDSPPLDMYRLEAAAKRGAQVVVIDPRRTETITRTGGEWIPIRPGTDGALALSMIEVMIAEDYYEENFAENWCHGFEELKTYVQHYTPEVTETITGIPAETIKILARKIATSNAACPVMYTGLEYSDSGIQAIRAVLSLFVLAGHLDVPGGIGLSMLNSHFPINRACNQENPALEKALARDKFPVYSHYRGESHASGLVSSVLTGKPYAIRGLIIHGASLLTSWPQSSLWRETLSKLDFQVCIDRTLTADAAFADIVLPATTMFEINSYMTYGPVFRIREKVIEPVGEARNDYLIMAELAQRLGYGDLYPQSEKEMISFALRNSGFSFQEIKDAGGRVNINSPVMEYKKWEKGKLRSDGKPGFETPTGKFEIWSTILEDHGYEPLPKYTEPEEGPIANPLMNKEYPLVFNSGARPHTDFRSQHHGIEGLLIDNPEPTIEINSVDARTRNIESGDLVEVHTPRGSVPFRARVTEDIIQGAVECNMGGGTPVGPKSWQEWNVNELTDLARYDKISGFPVYKALLCDLRKLEDGSPDYKKTVRNDVRLNGNLFEIDKRRKKPDRTLYLDNNATTHVLEEVQNAMLPYLNDSYGNPSALHGIGREARDGLEQARRQVGGLINARPKRIIFTGSGSESDNLALKGVAFKRWKEGNHIITTAIEHPAILKTCQFLETVGFEVTYLDVDHTGMIIPEKLRESIREDTILISMMMANNEVGTIQPVKALCTIAHEKGILFHTDAVQAAGKIPVDVEDLGVDLLTLSAHKFHGPKGVGALFVKKGIKLESLIHGGKQENNLRAGTENVAGIVGLGKAAELARSGLHEAKTISKRRDKLHRGIQKLIPEAIFNGQDIYRLPNTLNLTLPGMRGESLVLALDQHGIALSSGSACKSGSPDPTHVLLAMGRSEEEAHCSVRFSLSHLTTEKDITDTLKAIETVLQEMETTVRFLPCK